MQRGGPAPGRGRARVPGYAGEGPGAATRLGVAGVPQCGVRPGDGGPRDSPSSATSSRSEGSRVASGMRAVPDQQGQLLREAQVGGERSKPPSRAAARRADGRHEATLSRLALFQEANSGAPWSRDHGPAVPDPAPAERPGARRQLRAGRLGRRLAQLVLGLALRRVPGAMVRATLGLAPWDVLHSGLVRYVPITLGQMVVWPASRPAAVDPAARDARDRDALQRVVVGLAADATLAVLAAPTAPGGAVGLMVAGMVLNALATALYIGAQLGRGPRDGLMTGLARRTGALAAAGPHRPRGHRRGPRLRSAARSDWAPSCTPSRSARSPSSRCRGSPAVAGAGGRHRWLTSVSGGWR